LRKWGFIQLNRRTPDTSAPGRKIDSVTGLPEKR
jgi:hypothetical protein